MMTPMTKKSTHSARTRVHRPSSVMEALAIDEEWAAAPEVIFLFLSPSSSCDGSSDQTQSKQNRRSGLKAQFCFSASCSKLNNTWRRDSCWCKNPVVLEHLTLICLFSSRSLCTSICSCLHSSMIFFTSASSSEELVDLGSAVCSVLTEGAEEDTILVLSLSCCGETVGGGGDIQRQDGQWGEKNPWRNNSTQDTVMATENMDTNQEHLNFRLR